MTDMKRANGTGSIYKLSGNRRKPWIVRSSVVIDGKQRYTNLGYFETREKAERFLLSESGVEIGSNVYFISDGENIKIGKANNPEKRLAQLQTGNPRALRLLNVIKCETENDAFELESFLHTILQSTHLNGEWFHLPIERLDN